MENHENPFENENKSRKTVRSGGTSDVIYGMAFIGAAIYFIQHAAGFWMGVLGFLKALVWPAIVIYELLGFLKM